ncbi:uncharacterized protein MYCFIDRAFT_196190 [Pseudocercospora fijiensis CIRAD86]|uniref:Uncharacterized protein n=1 Tax=Pseudocercospora fijiensis (strain CIRAD86) TaxID=383855 RepID=M3AZW4_PSEFD|nr:uncharacterized protein MYCFIDRAFT_196190 [Pseudocercospora fijiensis CIRAD86]EME82703.1 hypothetical protein MYCFIDRAFT_196190 [Pseudocercospora fijiensis CIRAD86]
MARTRSMAGKKSLKSPKKPAPSKIKKSKKPAKPAKKKKNQSSSSKAEQKKRVSWDNTETEYSDDNDSISLPDISRSPTSYKAPKGNRRYSGNSRLVNNKGIYNGVRPKSSPGLGRKTRENFFSDEDDSSSCHEEGNEWVLSSPRPPFSPSRNHGASSPRMQMELKALELCQELSRLQVKFFHEGSHHQVFSMIAEQHLDLAVHLLLDMRKYPGSWPQGRKPISAETWRRKVSDALGHMRDETGDDGWGIDFAAQRAPLWGSVEALEESFSSESRRDPSWPSVGAVDERFIGRGSVEPGLDLLYDEDEPEEDSEDLDWGPSEVLMFTPQDYQRPDRKVSYVSL